MARCPIRPFPDCACSARYPELSFSGPILRSPTLRISLLVVCFGMHFGFSITSITGVLDALARNFQLTLQSEQILVASLVISCFFGAALAGPVSLRAGRRFTIFLTVALALAGYAIKLAVPDYGWLIVSRMLVGLATGLSSMVIPMYAAETAPARHRGAIVALFQLAITAGILAAYGIALAFASTVPWSRILAAGAVPMLLGLVAILLLPESPRWLAARGDFKRARSAAANLDLLGDWAEISATAMHGRKETAWACLRHGSTAAVLALCSLLFILQNLSGIDGILYYAPRIFHTLGFSPGTAALSATFGLGFANFVATLVALAVVDRAGRRPLLIWGSAVMILGLAAVVAAATFDWPWVGLGGLCLYITAFAVSLGPLPYVLMSELFPTPIREQGIAVASAVSWLFNALIAFTFLSIVESIGLAAAIALFLAVCVLSLVVCVLFVPETRAKPLELIEADVLAGLPLRQLGSTQQETGFDTIPGMARECRTGPAQ
ncbi:sugar porter family MFS transporter [Paralcaligenes sp. KSB-10]|uniref:sugar porter family MFS transporter n=1 Tax=Paralcaligenes sp. KSB-10 TaxID=2901142 RepID=UPI0021052FAA|nr:sugar porter family MFS transporter [Paralcaligenes sp. KSB-10]